MLQSINYPFLCRSLYFLRHSDNNRADVGCFKLDLSRPSQSPFPHSRLSKCSVIIKVCLIRSDRSREFSEFARQNISKCNSCSGMVNILWDGSDLESDQKGIHTAGVSDKADYQGDRTIIQRRERNSTRRCEVHRATAAKVRTITPKLLHRISRWAALPSDRTERIPRFGRRKLCQEIPQPQD